MFLIPLNQIESVDLVIHALRAAGWRGGLQHVPGAQGLHQTVSVCR